MAALKGNKNAVGNKGGRVSLYDDKIRSAVVNRCWKFLDEQWDNFTQVQRLDIATKFCVKNIPQEVGFSNTLQVKNITDLPDQELIKKAYGDNKTTG